jgi:hypothetical protein
MAGESSTTEAKRAAMSGLNEEKTGGATFDGTGDYPAWRRAQQVEAWMHDSSIAAAKVVFRRLRGSAIDTALGAKNTDDLDGFPFASVNEILVTLDTAYGGTTAFNKVEAVRQLARLRQGNKDFGAFAAEFQSLAGKSGLDNVSLIATLQAAVNSKLAGAAATIDEDTTLGNALARLKKIDQMTPNLPPRGGGGRGTGNSTRGRAAFTRGRGRGRGVPRDGPETRSCYGCGEKGHLSRECPNKSTARETRISDKPPPPPEEDDIVEHVHMSGNE